MRRAGVHAHGRRLVLLTGLAAAIPVIAATVGAVSEGWAAEGDQAIIATRAYDVLSSRTPLVGPWSTTSILVERPTFSPGPLLYWLLAVPSRLPGTTVLPVWMGLVNVAAVVGTVALARRRGGRPLMFATALALALMCASLKTEFLRDPWAPTAPVVMLPLLAFACWSVACGEYRLLPLAIVIASFATQCHLIYVAPGAGLLAVGLAGLAAGRLREPGATQERLSFWRWMVAALTVAALCWSGPVVDQVLGWAGSDRGYGNLETLIDTTQARQTAIGPSGAVNAVVRAIGVPPWWLRSPPSAVLRTFETFGRPGFGSIASAVLVLVGLVACAGVGLRRRRSDVVAACALALVLVGALAAVTAAFPNVPSTIFIYGYASAWAAPAGMFTWLALGWSALTLARPRLGALEPRRATAATGAALAVVAGVGAVVAAVQGPSSQRALYGPTRTLVRNLDAALPHPRAVRVDGNNLTIGSAVAHALRRRGATVGIDFGVQFGPSYEIGERRYDHVVDVRPSRMRSPGGRVLARYGTGALAGGAFTVRLLPAQAARRAAGA